MRGPTPLEEVLSRLGLAPVPRLAPPRLPRESFRTLVLLELSAWLMLSDVDVYLGEPVADGDRPRVRAELLDAYLQMETWRAVREVRAFVYRGVASCSLN